MRRQRRVCCAGRLLVLAAALAVGGGLGGCHALFSFEETDAGAGDVQDGDGGVEVDVDAREDGVDDGDGGGADGDDVADDGEVPVTCGDGATDAGEECDDGNDVSGDGCEPDCTWSCEDAADCDDGEVCDGEESCDAHLCVDGTPAPDGTDCTMTGGDPGVCRTGLCASALCGNSTVDPGEGCDDGNTDNTDGCLTSCVVASCGDGFVWSGNETCDDGNDVAGDGCEPDCTWTCEADPDCDDGDACSGDETCALHLCVAGTPLADGTLCTLPSGGSGVCRGEVCASIACGNRVVDPGEDCDDGNTSNSDACLNDCSAASCGDRHVWTGVEACDDGNGSDNDACLTTCLPAGCGDGHVWTGVEQCDDGNADDTDACLATCRNATCGDGFARAGVEECDDGNRVNTDDCINTCRNAACGDGFLWAGHEDCEGSTTRACTTGCSTVGTEACAACAWSATCTPPAETCNGADDDCDTLCDNGFACCAGATGPCTTACGSTGSRLCSAGCGWGACTPPAEICNGADDDCDTVCDNGSACCAGASGTCVTSCGSSGTRTCSAGCGWGSCTAPGETCNGADDDCDTVCDNGFGCCAGTPASCTTACSTPGTRPCSGACSPTGSCCAATETCGNGCDDDCDTTPDDGCSACPPCPGATEITGNGGRYTDSLTAGAGTTTGSCGGDGAEAVYTFTTDATRDVFVATHGTAFDTVVYVRTCTCSGSEVACNDDADGRNTSVLFLRDLPAGTYQVFVDGKTAAAGGAVSLDLYITAPGATGDRCGDPIRITGAGDTRDSCTFSADTAPTNMGNCRYLGTGQGEDVIYYFFLPTAASVRFQTCTSEPFCPTDGDSTCVDTDIYIRTNCLQDTAQVACDEDTCGYRIGGIRIHSDTGTVPLAAGLYYVIVDGYQETTGTWLHCGDYTLTVTGIP